MAALKRMSAVCALAVIGLIGVAPASAASPQRIYADLADNGRLDGRYSRADIARALDVQQVVGTDAPRQPSVRRPAANVTSRPRSANGSNAALPFTGLDLALLTVVGGPLLLLGFALRRRLSAQPSRAGVVRS
jgi:hypothetical protein